MPTLTLDTLIRQHRDQIAAEADALLFLAGMIADGLAEALPPASDRGA